MAQDKLPPLPPGFTLATDTQESLPPLPPGFSLEPKSKYKAADPNDILPAFKLKDLVKKPLPGTLEDEIKRSLANISTDPDILSLIKDPVGRFKDKVETTYWDQINKATNPQTYKNMVANIPESAKGVLEFGKGVGGFWSKATTGQGLSDIVFRNKENEATRAAAEKAGVPFEPTQNNPAEGLELMGGLAKGIPEFFINLATDPVGSLERDPVGTFMALLPFAKKGAGKIKAKVMSEPITAADMTAIFKEAAENGMPGMPKDVVIPKDIKIDLEGLKNLDRSTPPWFEPQETPKMSFPEGPMSPAVMQARSRAKAREAWISAHPNRDAGPFPQPIDAPVAPPNRIALDNLNIPLRETPVDALNSKLMEMQATSARKPGDVTTWAESPAQKLTDVDPNFPWKNVDVPLPGEPPAPPTNILADALGEAKQKVPDYMKPQKGGIKGLNIEFIDENGQPAPLAKWREKSNASWSIPKTTTTPAGGTTIESKPMGVDVDVMIENGRPFAKKVMRPPDEISPPDIIKMGDDIRRQSPPPAPEAPVAPGTYMSSKELDATIKDPTPSPAKQSYYRTLNERVHSPSEVFAIDPVYGKGLYETAFFSNLEKANRTLEIAKAYKPIAETLKGKGALDEAISLVRDKDTTISNVLNMAPDAAKKLGFTDESLKSLRANPKIAQDAINFYNDMFPALIREWGTKQVGAARESFLWDLGNKIQRNATKEPVGLSPADAAVLDIYKRKINQYFPHLFGDDIAQILDTTLAHSIAKLKEYQPGTKQFKYWDTRVKSAQENVNNMRGGNMTLWQDVPRSVNMPFFKPRKGATGYQLSSHEAFGAYVSKIMSKIYDDPVLKYWAENKTKIDPRLRDYSTWYLRRFRGMDRTGMDSIYANIRSFEWIRTLGLNPRSAIVNLTQRMNTVADVGPKYAIEGYAHALSKEGRELFDKTGLKQTIPEVLSGSTLDPTVAQGAMETLRRISGVLFSKVEEGNLRHAFSSYYVKAVKKGVAPEAAMKEAMLGTAKVQFNYGRVNTPRMLTGPGSVVFQYWSYPIKQIEFLTKMAKENPLKMLGLVGATEAMNYTLQEFLGIDLSNQLGIGVNWGNVWGVFTDLAKGDAMPAMEHFKGIIKSGGGLLPSGLGPATKLIPAIGKVLDNNGVDWSPIANEIVPAQALRVLDAKKALEGGKGEDGLYTLRNRKGEATYKENLAQILTRTTIAKPMVETREQSAVSAGMVEDANYNSLVRKISSLIVDGKEDEAQRLSEKTGVEPSKASILAEQKRRELIRTERFPQRPSRQAFRDFMDGKK